MQVVLASGKGGHHSQPDKGDQLLPLSLKDLRLEETLSQKSGLAWLFKSHGLKGRRLKKRKAHSGD